MFGGQANRLTALARERGYKHRMVQEHKEWGCGSGILGVLVWEDVKKTGSICGNRRG